MRPDGDLHQPLPDRGPFAPPVPAMTALDLLLDDEGQSGLFTGLARVGLLLDAFQHRCLDEFGLRFIDFSVLRVLDLAGEMTPSALADVTLRSTGGMTQIVDRLERNGLVGRTPSSADRRKVVVALTPNGKLLVDRAHTVYARERARVLGPLTNAELNEVGRAVRRLLALLEADATTDTPTGSTGPSPNHAKEAS